MMRRAFHSDARCRFHFHSALKPRFLSSKKPISLIVSAHCRRECSQFACSESAAIESHAPPEQSQRSVLPALHSYSNYHELCDKFEWNIPEYFNIGHECTDYWVHQGFGDKIAIIDHGSQQQYSYSELSDLTNNLSRNLRKFHGCVDSGQRIAVLLSQSINTALAHLACFKLGCISVPLFKLFGSDALQFRLNDSGASMLITDREGLSTVLPLCESGELKDLKVILVTEDGVNDTTIKTVPPFDLPTSDFVKIAPFEQLLTFQSDSSVDDSTDDSSVQCQTRSDDPAIIIYTSGTTGNPKGCLHAHRVLLGHLPGIELPHNRFVQTCKDVVFWTPADWAWIGGLFDVLFPSLYYGVTVVSHRMSKFSVEECINVMKDNQVTNTFLPPTAVKMMKGAMDSANEDTSLVLLHPMNSVGCGGETLGKSLLEFGQNAFETKINEFYGQTECNLLVSNSSELFPIKEGSMGRPVCGKIVRLLDENTGAEIETEESVRGDENGLSPPGVIAVLSSQSDEGYNDPAEFLGYWNLPEKTREKYAVSPTSGRRYLLTGDLARQSNDGYLWFVGRDDDVINSGGYRCGPGEIEEACLRHSSVMMAAAIGKPCPLRTEMIKVFLVPKDRSILEDSQRCDQIAEEVKELVKSRVGKHEYPREVEFVEKLHLTITGKVQRKQHKLEEIERMKRETT